VRNPSLQRIGESGLSAVQSEAKIALILRDILVNTLNNIPKRLTSAFSKRLSLRIRTELDMTQLRSCTRRLVSGRQTASLHSPLEQEIIIHPRVDKLRSSMVYW
jgi:hypothetical protein